MAAPSQDATRRFRLQQAKRQGRITPAEEIELIRLELRGTLGPKRKELQDRLTKLTTPTTTPSGKVAAAQRAKAVSDSPLKPTASKKPPSKKNVSKVPTGTPQFDPATGRDQYGMTREERAKFKADVAASNAAVVAAGNALGQARSGLPRKKGESEEDYSHRLADEARRITGQTDEFGKKPKGKPSTTSSGSVADAQRKQAVKDSPLKPTPTQAPKAKVIREDLVDFGHQGTVTQGDKTYELHVVNKRSMEHRWLSGGKPISREETDALWAIYNRGPNVQQTKFQTKASAEKALAAARGKPPEPTSRSVDRYTTPSGSVAAKQRKQAVKDSPLKPTPTKAPRATKKPVSSRANLSEANIRSMDALKGSADRRLSAGSKKPGTPRKLSMNPKQVARRKARGFPSGH